MERLDSFFPVSTWFSGGKSRAPLLSPINAESRDAWRADLRRIRDLGFNTVRTWVTWADGEPQPGVYRHDNLRLLCELAGELDLRVFLQVYAEAVPMWLCEQHPEAAFVAQTGERLEPQSVPGLCTDHADVSKRMLDFYRATARVTNEFPNFCGWDLWSEPHIVNWTIVSHIPNAQFCFCEHTKHRFRAWLEAKYTSLDNLNEAWGRVHARWDQVEPPRLGTILTFTDFLDWKAFIYAKMADDLRVRAEAVREVDPDHLISSHAAVPSGLTSPLSEWGGYGATDDFLMAKVVDRYGLSLYPKHSFPDRHWERWKIDFALDFARSANRANGGFVVGELQAGAGARGVVAGNPVTARDLRLWMWSAVARGAKSLNLYAFHPMSSGYEAGGYGLIGTDDALTGRAEEAGRIARMLGEHGATFARSQPEPAQVAIVYNPLTQLMGGEQSCGPTSLHSDSLIGYHRSFARHHVAVDFIHRLDLEGEDLSRYRLIILPNPIMLTRAAADGIRRFVEEGGCAFAEARLAWTDDRGHLTDAIPGLGLSDVFGAREVSVRMRESVRLSVCSKDHPNDHPNDHPAMRGFEPGAILTGAHFGETLKPREGSDTQTLATLEDGGPALIASHFGRGQTLFVGTFLGLAARHAPEPNRERLFLNLLDWAGVSRAFTVAGDQAQEVSVHVHRVTEGRLLFAINHGEREVRLRVTLPAEYNATHQARDLEGGATEDLRPRDGDLTLDLRLESGEVMVKTVRAD
jgi:beta-galactosidase